MIKTISLVILFAAVCFFEHIQLAGGSTPNGPPAYSGNERNPPRNFLHPRERSASSRENPPEKTVGDISSRSGDWREPSEESEKKYLDAISLWLDSLAPQQREKTRKILWEAHPALRNLRAAIRRVKASLASLNFDRDTPPETLPRLGSELQKLRQSLRSRLKSLYERLENEAGIQMQPLRPDSFWILPPASANSNATDRSGRAAPENP